MTKSSNYKSYYDTFKSCLKDTCFCHEMRHFVYKFGKFGISVICTSKEKREVKNSYVICQLCHLINERLLLHFKVQLLWQGVPILKQHQSDKSNIFSLLRKQNKE